MARQLKQGAGWRLGWDDTVSPFRGLVGSDEWAIELTQDELEDFGRLALQLASTLEHMQRELMDEESICCEAESDRIWLEVEGYPQAYSLRFILLTGRRGEGSWPAIAVPDLLQAIRTLAVF